MTLADWLHPNEHEGVFSEAEAARLITAREEGYVPINGVPIEKSPHAKVGEVIQDLAILTRIAFVRFGRVPTARSGTRSSTMAT